MTARIYIVTGLVMGTVALTAFWGMRKMRGSLTRQALPVFIIQLLMWSLFGVFLFSGVLSVMYFASSAFAPGCTNAGTIDALLWGAIQRGDWGLLDHYGWSWDSEIGWQPKPRPRYQRY